MCMCPFYRIRFDELFTDVQYWGVSCVVQVGYGLGEKKLFVCMAVLVLSDLQRRPEGNSSRREWAGCEGSRVNSF